MKNKTIIIGLVLLISIIAVSFVIFNSFKPVWVFATVVEKGPQNYVEITQKHIDKYPNLMKLFYEADLYHGDKGEPAVGLDAMIRLDHKKGTELIESLGEGYMEYGYYNQYVKYGDRYYLVWILFQYETPLRM